MQAYCAKASVDPESVAFVFDGNRLRAEQTPEEVDMEDVSCFSSPFTIHVTQNSACAVAQHFLLRAERRDSGHDTPSRRVIRSVAEGQWRSSLSPRALPHVLTPG